MGTHIVLFDGVCNLCQFWVRVLLRLDQRKILKFGSLQSPQTTKILGYKPEMESLIFISDGKTFLKSDGVIEIAKFLGFPWSLFLVFRVLPKFFRDFLYDGVARHRYSLFGRQNECLIPTADLKSRFID